MRRQNDRNHNTVPKRTYAAGFGSILLGAGILTAACFLSGTSLNENRLFCLEAEASAAEKSSISSEEDAQWYMQELLTGDAEALLDTYRYTEEMENALKSAGGMSGIRNSLAIMGEPKQIGPAVFGEQDGYTFYRVHCTFPLMKLDFVISLDQENRIAGIVTAACSGNDEGETADREEVTEKEEALAEDGGYEEISLALPTPYPEGGELPGTLLLPQGDGPFPAVVLIHGSGPNDRDETIGPNAPFRDIAEGLVQHGIAVYRYDKGSYVYGAELAKEVNYTLKEETVDDAVGAVKLLSEKDQIDPEQIFVLGHSLGGMALPAIWDEAQKEEQNVCGCIFLAAPGRKLPELMKEQFDYLNSLTPDLTEDQKAEWEKQNQELEKLSDLSLLKEDDQVLGIYKPYWQALEEYDFLAMAREITAPCLVLQGEEDYQISMEDYQIWQNMAEGLDNWEFHSYPGLTHLFMPGEKSEGSASYMRAQKVDEQVIRDIAAFIQGDHSQS